MSHIPLKKKTTCISGTLLLLKARVKARGQQRVTKEISRAVESIVKRQDAFVVKIFGDRKKNL